MSNSVQMVMIEVEFYKDELQLIREEAAFKSQTLEEFMREASRDFVAHYRKTGSLLHYLNS